MNVGPVRRCIIFRARELYSASQVIAANELRLQIQGRVLYFFKRIRFARPDC